MGQLGTGEDLLWSGAPVRVVALKEAPTCFGKLIWVEKGNNTSTKELDMMMVPVSAVKLDCDRSLLKNEERHRTH